MITELLNIVKHSEAQRAKLHEELEVFAYHYQRRCISLTKILQTIEGFGLSQIKARLNNIKGEIKINSKKWCGHHN
jgi:signal transduction histidine kinase